ncbi:MAG: glycosyltransferase [bacterium]
MRRIKALFLYVSFSSGHQRAAEAIMEAFGRRYPEVQTKGVNSFSYAHPGAERFVGRTYLEMLKRTPQLWGYLYDNKNVADATSEIRGLLGRLNLKKYTKLITGYSPDVVVCTQAAPCAAISNLKEKGHRSLRLVAVITDFKAHSYWLCEHVDIYIVPTFEVMADLMRKGVGRNKIHVLGIPIDPKFNVAQGKAKARHGLGMDPDLKTILVMGGGQGFGPMEDILKELSMVNEPFQAIVITGRNKKLYRKLKKTQDRLPYPVRVMGFTRHVEKVMDASDLIITKPGGMTSSEALAKGLPIIIVDPIPGQEERNSQFLVHEKVALRIDDIRRLHNLVSDLLSNDERLHRMKRRAFDVSRPNAAINSVEAIMDLVDYASVRDAVASLNT